MILSLIMQPESWFILATTLVAIRFEPVIKSHLLNVIYLSVKCCAKWLDEICDGRETMDVLHCSPAVQVQVRTRLELKATESLSQAELLSFQGRLEHTDMLVIHRVNWLPSTAVTDCLALWQNKCTLPFRLLYTTTDWGCTLCPTRGGTSEQLQH